MKRTIQTGVLAALAIAVVACSGDLSQSSSPVALVVTSAQAITRFDLQANAAGCNVNVATITVHPILLTSRTNSNLPVDTRFHTVQLTAYRVTYVRRDGGTLVPAPITRALSQTIDVGDEVGINALPIETAALTQAPFAALTPSGGGRDPETGRNVVTLDAVVEVFGQTLAGERVSGTTRMTLDFCYACGGCR